MPTRNPKPTPNKPTRNRASNKGSGAIAQGDGATSLGRNAKYVGRDLIAKQIILTGRDPATLALKVYLEALRNECTVLPIAAMGGAEEARRDVTLDRVYIDLDTTIPVTVLDREGQRAFEAAPDSYEQKQKRLPVLNAVLMHQNVVLLGGPGSGKSSFVNQLISEVAAARLKKPHRLKDAPPELLARIPVKVVLRELAERLAESKLTLESSERDLCEAVWAHWASELKRLRAAKAEDKLLDLLQKGHGLLVFDGLDEVALESRLIIRKAVGAVLTHYPSARVIVTCRSRSYPESHFEGFDEFTLGNLNEQQIKDFIAAWYGAHVTLNRLQAKEADDRAKDLTDAALNNYRKLASESPLLLTVMAIVHRKGVTLPRHEVLLYDEAVKVLLSRWQQEKRLKLHPDVQSLLSRADKLDEVVQAIAYAQHALQGSAKDPQALMPRRDVIDLLEQPDLLGPEFNINEFLNFVDQVSGLLIGHGGHTDERDKRPLAYGFPHRTFQEYLAGRRMMWDGTRARKQMLLERAAEGDYWAVTARYGWESLLHLGNTRNSDLPELAIALCPNAEPTTPARWRSTVWAGRMAALAGKEVIAKFAAEDDPDLLDKRLIPRLLAALTGDQLPAVERAQAGDALAALGDPRFSAERWGLPVTDDWGFIHIPAGPFYMGIRPEDFDKVMDLVGIDEENRKHPIWQSEIYPNDNTVTLPDFCIARYPVTVAQFRAFAQAKDRVEQHESALADPDNHPVRYVSWYDAQAYCVWLTTQLRQSLVAQRFDALFPKGWRVALPSEAEWEKAARGGPADNLNPNRIFPWSDDKPNPERANYADTRIGSTSTVGGFSSGTSPYSCEEMAGNLWEWTRTVWGKNENKPEFNYPYRIDDGREDEAAKNKKLRVMRGGSWALVADYARCAVRIMSHRVDLVSSSSGFRVVVVATPKV